MTFEEFADGVAARCVFLVREGLCEPEGVPWLTLAKIRYLIDENIRQRKIETEIRDELREKTEVRRPASGRRADEVVADMMRKSAEINKGLQRKAARRAR